MGIAPPLTSELQVPAPPPYPLLSWNPPSPDLVSSVPRERWWAAMATVCSWGRAASTWVVWALLVTSGQLAAESTAHAHAPAVHDQRACVALSAQKCLHLAHSQRCDHWWALLLGGGTSINYPPSLVHSSHNPLAHQRTQVERAHTCTKTAVWTRCDVTCVGMGIRKYTQQTCTLRLHTEKDKYILHMNISYIS